MNETSSLLIQGWSHPSEYISYPQTPDSKGNTESSCNTSCISSIHALHWIKLLSGLSICMLCCMTKLVSVQFWQWSDNNGFQMTTNTDCHFWYVDYMLSFLKCMHANVYSSDIRSGILITFFFYTSCVCVGPNKCWTAISSVMWWFMLIRHFC